MITSYKNYFCCIKKFILKIHTRIHTHIVRVSHNEVNIKSSVHLSHKNTPYTFFKKKKLIIQ